MEQYNFYYDESEHSRKINFNTINAESYYDNFIAVIVGWKAKDEKPLFEKYIAFEEKYAYRKSENELKSKTLRLKNLENGFASMNKNDVNLLNDFFEFFDENISIYFAVLSKIEFIVSQIFEDYENSFLYDMDFMKYSIVKAILMYQPKEIIQSLFDNSEELVACLKSFFKERIE